MAASQVRSNKRVIVGLDIGTYASGYAFQFATDFDRNRLHIYANKKWNANSCGLSTYKTLTCLLLNPDKSIEEFGFDADYKYSEWRSGVKGRPYNWKDYYYFRHFKMNLYHTGTVDNDLKIEAAEGNHLPAIDVFSKTIEYLKIHVEDHLKESGRIGDEATVYEAAETLWVLTVPAIWHETAKTLMRRAAIKAGIPDSSLILALEPECAAVYCSQLTRDALEIRDNNGKLRDIASAGSTVMIVDIGGGTVDISTIQFDNNSKMEQVHKSNGGPWGGVLVNEKILEIFEEVTGEKVMNEFTSKYAFEEYELRIGIETEKRQVKEHKDGKGGKESFKLTIPYNLMKTWTENNKGDFFVMLQEKGLEIECGCVLLDLKKIRGFFDHTIDGILKCLKAILKGDGLKDLKIDAMIIVGGFAESPYVIEKLRTGLQKSKIAVVRPQEPEKAILFGAVLYGQNKDIITTRIMRHTYGVGMSMKFNSKLHREDERFNDGKMELANNVFRKHVSLNQSVNLNQWIGGKEYFPENEMDSTVSVYLYSSDKLDPIHTTEDGCICIGKIDVDFDKSTKNRKKKAVKVEFSFGGTELKVRAVTNQSGEEFTKRLEIK